MEQLTPKQVARAIGVSEASLKRWCDKGLIETVRTAGGHRRLPLASVVRFIRTSGHQLVRPEILGLPATSGNGKTVESRSIETLLNALMEGDEQRFQRIVFDLYLARSRLRHICDRMIAPAINMLGERW